VVVNNPSFNDMHADFHAEDVDDAVDFAATADVNDRVRTAASVAWSEDNLSNSAFNPSPEIKTLIQEIVDRGGWASGQDMCILGIGKSDIAKSCSLNDYSDDTAEAAKLHIEFTAAGIGADEMMAAIGQQTGGGGGSGDIMAHSRKPPEVTAY
jgi:hypothetical protein